MRCVSVLLALAAVMAWRAGGASSSLDDVAAAELEAAGLVGVSYAVVGEDGVVSGAQGVADLRTGRAVTPDTPFSIGSISKSFTALAILQLVEAGDVALDGPVSLYLDGFAERPTGDITIRQLLAHTSGYSTRQGNDSHGAGDEIGDEDVLARQVDTLAGCALAHAPGRRWDYSNANYIVLGGVVEAVSGMAYDRYIQTRILDPIGMGNSWVAGGDRVGGEAGGGVAVGHVPWFGAKRPVKGGGTSSRAIAPAGGIVASANDLALYLGVLLNGADDIINTEHKALMMRPANAQAPFYGLGWALNPGAGTVYHTGTSPGSETLAMMVPAQGKGVVVLVNAGSGMGFGETGNLRTVVSAQALGLAYARDGSAWGRQALFAMFVALPGLFCAGLVQVCLARAGLRAKSGLSGGVSLWFPLVMMVVLAWVCVGLIPGLFGVSLGGLAVFSPDFSLCLLATAVTGVVWAVFRLCIYYGGAIGFGRL